MHSMTAIVTGHQLFSATASKLRFYDKQLTILISKPKRVRKPKISVSYQTHRCRFRLPSSTETEPKFLITACTSVIKILFGLHINCTQQHTIRYIVWN